MFLIGCVNILWAEKLLAGRGLGWDGRAYAQWAVEFYKRVFVIHIPEYYVQRILPSAIVHYSMRLIGAPFTRSNIILAFAVLNLCLLVASAFVWGLIADELGVTARGKWLGFFFLFSNYAILKNNFYHSVLTDTTAFALGVLLFYFYLSDRPLGLLVTMIAGGFTWPTFVPFAVLLYVFPRRRAAAPVARPILRRGNVAVASLVALAALAALLYLTGPLRPRLEEAFGKNSLRIDFVPIYFSIFCTVVYLFFGLQRACDDDALFDIRRIVSELVWRRVAVAMGIMVTLKIITHSLANGKPGWATFPQFTAYTLLTSITEPLIFLVAHITYFGPAVLLLVFFWKNVSDGAGELGLGMRLFLILAFIPSLNSQSRYGVNLLIVFVALITVVLDRFGITAGQFGILTALTLIWSKVWFKMNTGPQIDDGTMDALLRGPLQRYFMHSGPWMSHEMYLIHAAGAAATAVVIYVFVVRCHRAVVDSAAASAADRVSSTPASAAI